MGILEIISKHFRLINYAVYFKSVRQYSKYDKNFYYFRNKNEYKNSIVCLNDDISGCNVAGPGFSFFLKGQNFSTEGLFYHLMKRENVMKLSTTQLKDIMCLMANGNFETAKFPNVLKYLDEKCAVSVEKWPLDLSLYIFDAWFITLGPKVFKKCYYSAVTSVWSRRINKCSNYNLLLMLYYIGMSKASSPFLMGVLEDKLETLISHLSDEEWAIACISFFKTSTKIKSNKVLKHCCIVAQNLLLKNDNFNLISVLKCLRLSKYFDGNLMKMLEGYIKKEYRSFNFVECTNFLASFTTQNFYIPELYSCLEIQGISLLSQEDSVKYKNQNIEKIHPSLRSRVKDLARFLWSMAFVGHNIKIDSVNSVIKLLNERLYLGEFEANLPCLIDCLQSLVLLGHYPQSLMEYILQPSFLYKMSNIDKAKPKYQTYFIYRSAYIDKYITEPKNFKHFNHIPKSLEKDIEDRKGFQDILNYLNNNLNEKSFKCCYIMPHIMISGIFIATKYKENKYHQLETSVTKTLLKLIQDGVISKHIQDILNENTFYTCIEILDPSVCAHESILPLGLMKTKLRQLKKLGVNVVTFTPEEINTLTQSSNQTCIKLANLFV